MAWVLQRACLGSLREALSLLSTSSAFSRVIVGLKQKYPSDCTFPYVKTYNSIGWSQKGTCSVRKDIPFSSLSGSVQKQPVWEKKKKKISHVEYSFCSWSIQSIQVANELVSCYHCYRSIISTMTFQCQWSHWVIPEFKSCFMKAYKFALKPVYFSWKKNPVVAQGPGTCPAIYADKYLWMFVCTVLWFSILRKFQFHWS